MKKENLYNRYQTEVKDKDFALFTFMQRVLCMTSKMFEYTGTPETMPPVELEKILQTSGNVGIAKVNGELYALQGTRSAMRVSVGFICAMADIISPSTI